MNSVSPPPADDPVPVQGLRLLGEVGWHADGMLHPFRRERRCQLLALLACRRDWVTRVELATQLWPQHLPADALRNLRKIVMQATQLAATLPRAPALELQDDRLRWCVPSDLADFLQACDAGEHAQAVRCYRPGLLDNLQEGLGEGALDWLARQRAWLEQRWHGAAAHWLGGLRHDLPALASAAELVLAQDPLHEATLRTLLQACRALDEPARAQRALQLHVQRLERELGAAPAADLALAASGPAPLVTPPARSIAADAVQRIIEAAMDVVADSRQLPLLLERLTLATHGIGSMVAGSAYTRPQQGLLRTHGLDLALGQRYLQHYQDNPWARVMQTVPPGRAVDQSALVAAGVVERTPFHQEIVRPQGIYRMTAMAIPLPQRFDSSGISIAFGGSHARMHAAEAAQLLDHLAPYLQRAATALLREHAPVRTTVSERALQGLSGAAMILSADARLLFANRSAEALLARGDGLRLVRGRLSAAHPSDAAHLEHLLRQAALAAFGPSAPRQAALRLRAAALRLRVAPLRAQGGPEGVPPRAAVLVLADASGG